MTNTRGRPRLYAASRFENAKLSGPRSLRVLDDNDAGDDDDDDDEVNTTQRHQARPRQPSQTPG